jgi:hypothetical protein
LLALVILLASCAGYEAAEKTAAEQAAELPEPTVRYLSADDSNSAASPVITRKIIRQQRYVHPALVRTYEFLNYYSFDYTPPVEHPIAVVPQLRALEREGEFSLQVAVRSQDRTLPELSPFNITFLLDTSGSMAGEPLELSRALILGIAGKLRPDDRISLVTCNRQTEVLLDAQPVDRLPQGRLAGIGVGEGFNDQMIYHLTVSTTRPLPEAREQHFEFEVEYSPIGGRRDRLTVRPTVLQAGCVPAGRSGVGSDLPSPFRFMMRGMGSTIPS